MDYNVNGIEPKEPAATGQLSQSRDFGKRTDFWKAALFALLILFIVTSGFLGFQFYKKSSSEKPLVQRQSDISKESVPTPSEEDLCEPLSQKELVGLLPQEANLYELKHNSFNSSNCYYSINIFFPKDMNKKIERDITKNQLVGCWIIDLKTKTANRLTNWPQDYSFSKWISEIEVELMGDDDDTASIFNVKTGEIVSRRVNQLNLRFTKGQDRMVSFKSEKQIEGCTFKKEMVQNWAQYPFACVEKSDVTIQVDSYPDMLLKYVDKETVEIDGKTFGDLLDQGSWKIEL